MKPTITTTDADPSVAPTAALPAADLAPTSPAEEGRQPYTIRRYRLDNVSEAPTFVDEITSASLDTIYGDQTQERRIIISYADELDHTLEVYACRTPMHAVAMLSVMYATEDDMQQAAPKQMLTREQRTQQAEEPAA